MDPEAIQACVVSMAIVGFNLYIYIFESDCAVNLQDKKISQVKSAVEKEKYF